LGRFTGGGQVGAGAPPTQIIYELLDTHIAVGTEATYTFTPADPLDNDTYSEIVSVLDGDITAILALQMKVNALATLYSVEKLTVVGGVITGVSQISTPQWELIGTALLNIATRKFAVVTHLMIGDSAFSFPHVGGFYQAKADLGYVTGTLRQFTNGEDDITSIEWKTSASTWTAGTTIDTYGVRRVV